MSPGHNNLPSKSIKEVPGRSKSRIESINPVPTGNPKPRSSKVKLISPEEAIKLSSGVTQTPLSPKHKHARSTPGVSRPVQAHRNFQPSRPVRPPPTFVPPTKPVFAHRPPPAPRPQTSRRTPEAPRHVSGLTARSTFEAPGPVLVCPFSEPPRPVSGFSACSTTEATRPVLACPTSEPPRPVSGLSARSTPEATIPVQVWPNSEPSRPVSTHPEAPRPLSGLSARSTPEATKPVQVWPNSEPSRPVSAHPEAPRPVTGLSARSTPEATRPFLVRPLSEPRRPASAHPAAIGRREIDCGIPAFLSVTIQTVRRKKTNRRHRQATTVEPPPSPRALQIRSRVEQQAANATQAVQGTTVEVGAGATDSGSKEILVSPGTNVEVGTGDTAKDHGASKKRKSPSGEELSDLLRYRPALRRLWKGRIVDSATSSEFDCEFWGQPASNIRKKAYKRSKVIPTLLEVELLPTGQILNDVFGKTPSLSNVEIYLFPDEKQTERFNGEHARLFNAMETRNAMFNVPIKGKDLFIFSSKLLDETSQSLIKTQKKSENFLWGFFPKTKKPVSLVPGTSSQTDKVVNDDDVADMDLDGKYSIPPSLANKLIEVFERVSSRSPEKAKSEASLPPPGFEETSVPPGFEKKWVPPLVKLNVQGTSNPKSEVSGIAGLVRDESGKWVFGYSRCHKRPLDETSAGLVAIYEGLSILWDSGFRKVHVETTCLEIVNVLTTDSNMYPKRRSILDLCKDMLLKDWECNIYYIFKEENSCAEWLASKVEEEHQGLVFFEDPPRGLMDRLEKDRLAIAKASSA